MKDKKQSVYVLYEVSRIAYRRLRYNARVLQACHVQAECRSVSLWMEVRLMLSLRLRLNAFMDEAMCVQRVERKESERNVATHQYLNPNKRHHIYEERNI
jgi:hypothetical protein